MHLKSSPLLGLSPSDRIVFADEAALLTALHDCDVLVPRRGKGRRTQDHGEPYLMHRFLLSYASGFSYPLVLVRPHQSQDDYDLSSQSETQHFELSEVIPQHLADRWAAENKRGWPSSIGFDESHYGFELLEQDTCKAAKFFERNISSKRIDPRHAPFGVLNGPGSNQDRIIEQIGLAVEMYVKTKSEKLQGRGLGRVDNVLLLYNNYLDGVGEFLKEVGPSLVILLDMYWSSSGFRTKFDRVLILSGNLFLDFSHKRYEMVPLVEPWKAGRSERILTA